jgi:hypothetical protein
MISRRKILQGALGFASAAILPSGIIMPIKVLTVPKKDFEWYWDGPWPESIVSKMQPVQKEVNDHLVDAMRYMGRMLDEADVPQHDRYVWVPEHQPWRIHNVT